MSERLIYNITIPKIMDLGFSIVSDILFITKHKNDHNFGPNLNIDKILSVIDSPGHPREAKKEKKALSHIFFNCMFYQLLRVQRSCSSTQSWGSVPPSIVQTRDQNSRLFLNRTLGSFCA